MSASYRQFFQNKAVTVMGLGLLGRGIGDVRFLAACGAKLTVTDLKTAVQLAEALEQLKDFPDIHFVLGEHREEDFTSADMVMKAAGVPLDSAYIKAAEEAGVPVYMSTALFAKFTGATLIGVTGTRGKSTVAQMVYEALKVSDKAVHLGGNIRGMSTLAMLPEVKEGDLVVLELDSWQLQGFRDLAISPQIAVFTTFMPDHMNYYHGDLDQYFADKAAIFTHQGAGDVLIVGPDIVEQVRDANPPAEMIVPESLPDDWALSVPGDHNRQNAALALEVLRALGLPDDQSCGALQAYQGLDGRLSFVGEIGGVKIYNDSNATTPQAAAAALNAFEPGKILLLAGGTDKDLEIAPFVEAIQTRCKETVFLKGSGTDRMKAHLPDVLVFDNLAGAFESLMQSAASGDILVLSPGFTSFGMFTNEYDRSDQFKAAVQSYKNRSMEGAA